MTTATETHCYVDRASRSEGTTVNVTGVLNWLGAPELRQAVTEPRVTNRLLIDLTEVTRMDSAGTGALIATFLRSERDGIAMAIAAKGGVASLLDRIGLAARVPVFGDRTAAAEWLAS